VEMQLPEGEEVFQLEYEALRPVLENLKPRWQALVEGRKDFYLEDKGWALALHARFADEEESEEVLRAAERILSEETRENFRVLGGHKFLEFGPQSAHKGKTVQRILEQYPWPGALLVYFGDDDKDEEAFEVIQANQGLAVVVARQPRPTRADFRLESPAQVRRWLEELILTQI
jgi:trehalose 6-phosphate phosphatase